MTAAQKILSDIAAAAQLEADKKQEAAKAEAEQILNEARRRAQEIAADAEKAAEERAKIILASAETSAAKQTRDETLAVKREIIDSVLAEIPQRLNALADGEYFEILCRLLKNSGMKSGTLSLSGRDLERDLSVLNAALSETGITLSRVPEKISGGFVLRNGDIEINSSFEAILREKRGALTDEVNKILFAKG